MKNNNTVSTDQLLNEINDLPSLDLENDPEFVADYTKGKIVEDILSFMVEHKLTQSDLAQKMNKSRQYISRILNQKANFTIETISELSCALKCDLSIKLTQRSSDEEYQAVTSNTMENVYAFPIDRPKLQNDADLEEVETTEYNYKRIDNNGKEQYPA